MTETPMERAFGAGAAAPLAETARRVAATMVAERERWPLWIPVCMGGGIALYFALPAEPAAWLGGFAVAAALAAAAGFRRRPAWLAVSLALLAASSGFAGAQLRAHSVAAPVLTTKLRPAVVTGRVVANEVRVNDHRLVLDRVRIEGLDAPATPERVRVSVRGQTGSVVPGQWVRLRAALSPPPGPAAPGAFDFARRAYFEGLGAVGFAFPPLHVVAPPDGEAGTDWAAALGRFRHAVTARLRAGLEGQTGAVAAALLTGERGAIPKPVLAAMRDAGLAHLLAISGLHVGLVAATLFFAVRALLALCESVALRYPIKKWAACAALAGTAFYLLLSGATIPTQRAFLMGALVLGGILLDRTGVSMRSVAWAATVVLLLHPESLLGPSFQMSFAAVIALVAFYEAWRDRRASWSALDAAPRRVLLYLVGVALMTLIASSATAPFVLYHFNRVAAYGLAANMLAVPITALWIMPWGIAALIVMPFGLEAFALAPMGWGIDAVIAVASTVSAWPGAVRLFPVMPMAGLALAAAGGLWLCLWRRRWRWLGVLPFVAGLLSPAFGDTPDVLVDGDAKLFAVRTADGALALSSRRTNRFGAGIWLRRNGQAAPAEWSENSDWLRCDAVGCVYRAGGRVVALVRDGRALAEDCRVADIVVSMVPVRRRCPSAEVTIDRFDLWRNGAHALYLDAGRVRVESVGDDRGARLWAVRRGDRGGN
ncbi:MAG: ComEC/Rec2 family competence protein [Proteobacteria bacterium]|nr:ComEC/Rec2 family competence protein [Pseudomonadota bacterium]